MRHPQHWYFSQYRCNIRKISAKRYRRAKLRYFYRHTPAPPVSHHTYPRDRQTMPHERFEPFQPTSYFQTCQANNRNRTHHFNVLTPAPPMSTFYQMPPEYKVPLVTGVNRMDISPSVVPLAWTIYKAPDLWERPVHRSATEKNGPKQQIVYEYPRKRLNWRKMWSINRSQQHTNKSTTRYGINSLNYQLQVLHW